MINNMGASPCNKNCIMDSQLHLCRGCYRTLNEIARWSFYSEEERNEINKKIEERKRYLSEHNNHIPPGFNWS